MSGVVGLLFAGAACAEGVPPLGTAATSSTPGGASGSAGMGTGGMGTAGMGTAGMGGAGSGSGGASGSGGSGGAGANGGAGGNGGSGGGAPMSCVVAMCPEPPPPFPFVPALGKCCKADGTCGGLDFLGGCS